MSRTDAAILAALIGFMVPFFIGTAVSVIYWFEADICNNRLLFQSNMPPELRASREWERHTQASFDRNSTLAWRWFNGGLLVALVLLLIAPLAILNS